MKRVVEFAAGALLLVVVAGCGGRAVDPNRPKVAPAEGVVTYKGSAVEGATVTFIPDGGTPAAYGTTDSSGQFAASAFPPDEGAAPGRYKVTISKTETSQAAGGGHDAETTFTKNLLPAKYASPETSGLTAEIPEGGKTDIKFELTD